MPGDLFLEDRFDTTTYSYASWSSISSDVRSSAAWAASNTIWCGLG